jgi:hypothetical protein
VVVKKRKLKKNKQLERKKLFQFHFVSNQLRFHAVQLVQEVDHVVVVEVLALIVSDQIEMINQDVSI